MANNVFAVHCQDSHSVSSRRTGLVTTHKNHIGVRQYKTHVKPQLDAEVKSSVYVLGPCKFPLISEFERENASVQVKFPSNLSVPGDGDYWTVRTEMRQISCRSKK